MLKPSRSSATLLLLSSTLLFGGVACSNSDSNVTKNDKPDPLSSPAAAVVTPANPAKPVAPPQTNQPDPYKLGLDKADSARSISQSAQSQDDWSLVAHRWEQAIQFMKSVPSSSPNRVKAKSKLAEYQRSLAYAKKKASQKVVEESPYVPEIVADTGSDAPPAIVRRGTQITASNSRSGERGVFRARIKRREGGTPVIDVVFNGRRSFEMIVDTGASGTVITERMAAALGANIVGKTKVDTASQKDVEIPLAYVNSISVGGASIKGVIVAVGNSALDTGLLGHDFFGDFDVTVKRDVVEFRVRS